MADGTLRLTVDIEPRNAQAAFSLFGSPGTPMALAALKTAKATPDPEKAPEQPEKPKGGELSRWSAMRCKEMDFVNFLRSFTEFSHKEIGLHPEDWAKDVIYNVCGVTSRAELDTNKPAGQVFKDKILHPYAEWLKTHK